MRPVRDGPRCWHGMVVSWWACAVWTGGDAGSVVRRMADAVAIQLMEPTEAERGRLYEWCWMISQPGVSVVNTSMPDVWTTGWTGRIVPGIAVGLAVRWSQRR